MKTPREKKRQYSVLNHEDQDEHDPLILQRFTRLRQCGRMGRERLRCAVQDNVSNRGTIESNDCAVMVNRVVPRIGRVGCIARQPCLGG